MSDQWRMIRTSDRMAMVARLQSQMTERWIAGLRTHGPTFQGDPLAHAREESVDSLFYIEAAERERDALRRRVAELEQQIERMSP